MEIICFIRHKNYVNGMELMCLAVSGECLSVCEFSYFDIFAVKFIEGAKTQTKKLYRLS